MVKCAAVRRFPLICVVLISLASTCLGDVTIRLKNGKTIVADEASEKNGRIEYTVGENTFRIPKSMVESVDDRSVPQPLSGENVKPAAPAAALARPAEAALPSELINAERVAQKVIRDGKVDDDALRLIEDRHSSDAAAAYFAAGRFEFDRGNRERARQYFESALRFAPQSDMLLSHYAAALVQLGRAAEAAGYAEQAARIAPHSADAQTVLGFAYYGSGRTADAIDAWKKALDLRPDDTLKKYVAKAEREIHTEAAFTAALTGHFAIHFEGASTSEKLRRQIETELENAYADLVREFGVVPPNPTIPVSLYTNQAFFDVTQAPAWSGAVNDGKLRLPVQGLTEVTPEFKRVLRHELTHSFIAQMAGGRCPQWLNEGIAQLMEPRTTGNTRGPKLAQLYGSGNQIPLNALEPSFLTFSPMEAMLAYDESLAAAEYIRDTYGMADLQTILTHLGEGSSVETALRMSIHTGYSGLEGSIGRYLAAKYGR